MRRGCHRAITLYDTVYRLWFRVDSPQAGVPPLLRLETRRALRRLRLSDGVVIRPGHRVGMLHLDNARVRAFHSRGLAPMTLGLEFRRQLIASLARLAELTAPGGPFADVRAVAAVTIFHRGLRRLGFERDPVGLVWPAGTGAYQRALLASMHPAGAGRILGLASRRAERLWMSSARVRARFGPLPLPRE